MDAKQEAVKEFHIKPGGALISSLLFEILEPLCISLKFSEIFPLDDFVGLDLRLQYIEFSTASFRLKLIYWVFYLDGINSIVTFGAYFKAVLFEDI